MLEEKCIGVNVTVTDFGARHLSELKLLRILIKIAFIGATHVTQVIVQGPTLLLYANQGSEMVLVEIL